MVAMSKPSPMPHLVLLYFAVVTYCRSGNTRELFTASNPLQNLSERLFAFADHRNISF